MSKVDEEWREISGYEGLYEVSNMGRVRSLRFRNGQTNKKREEPLTMAQGEVRGYSYVILADNNHIARNHRVHRLVAQAFLPNPNNYPEVNHKNEIRNDNRAENLEWCTRSYNQSYGNWYANNMKRIKNQMKKVGKFDADGNLIDFYESINEAARINNVSAGSICNVCKGSRKRNRVGGFFWKYIDLKEKDGEETK